MAMLHELLVLEMLPWVKLCWCERVSRLIWYQYQWLDAAATSEWFATKHLQLCTRLFNKATIRVRQRLYFV